MLENKWCDKLYSLTYKVSNSTIQNRTTIMHVIYRTVTLIFSLNAHIYSLLVKHELRIIITCLCRVLNLSCTESLYGSITDKYM